MKAEEVERLIKQARNESYKAGQESVMVLTHPYFQVIAKHHHQAGIREVIERYKKDNPGMYRKYQAYWELREEEWGLTDVQT